jgi:hypothetical protein
VVLGKAIAMVMLILFFPSSLHENENLDSDSDDEPSVESRYNPT